MWYRCGALIVCSLLLAGCGKSDKLAPAAAGGGASPVASMPPASVATRYDEAKYAAGEAKEAAAEAKDAASEPKAEPAPLQADLRVADEVEQVPDTSAESYAHIHDNRFLSVARNPLSTFSIDVDTASYSNVRRFLTSGQLPPPNAVRIEEMINYFTYNYPQPMDGVPFSVNVEMAACPWKPEHRLVRIGLRGKEVVQEQRPVSNLVFLLDVSGSMNEPRKLPLLQEGMKLLVNQLTENDRVAIVVYAGASGLVLDSTTADQKQTILSAIDHLNAGGSTNGGAGIELAYQVATKYFIKKGVNRVILATDGDFNVGRTSHEQLLQLIQDKAQSGVFLSVLGFGSGNIKDDTMEMLADKGNGNYAYIDSLDEARKVLVEQMTGTLITIAKDAKIQIEFNPAKAGAYRLIGYENRRLANADFDNDKKDAGEIGAGHTVTALYEVIPAGLANTATDSLRYQPAQPKDDPKPVEEKTANELLTLKLRYKEPDGEKSQLAEFPVTDQDRPFGMASPDFAWASSVAAFGMILRNSEFRGSATLPFVLEVAKSAKQDDKSGYREEFIRLVQQAMALQPGVQNKAITGLP